MLKNKSIIFCKENNNNKKWFQPIKLKNKIFFDFQKIEKKMKLFRDNYCQSEKKLNINKSQENQKNEEQNYQSNNDIPLIIIRNVSFYSPKIK